MLKGHHKNFQKLPTMDEAQAKNKQRRKRIRQRYSQRFRNPHQQSEIPQNCIPMLLLVFLIILGLFAMVVTIKQLVFSLDQTNYTRENLQKLQSSIINNQKPQTKHKYPHQQQLDTQDNHQFTQINHGPIIDPRFKNKNAVQQHYAQFFQQKKQIQERDVYRGSSNIVLPENQDELFEVDNQKCTKKGQKRLKFQKVYSVSDQYINIDSVKPFPELPICILAIHQDIQELKKIDKSIKQQKNFSNFKTVNMFSSETQSPTSLKNVYQYKNLSYFTFKKATQEKCQQNPLILIAHNPLAPSALSKLNQIHQSFKVWTTFSSKNDRYEIRSFYKRILDLVDINAFEDEKKDLLGKQEANFIGLAFMELSKRFKMIINESDIFESQNQFSPFALSNSICVEQNRVPYEQLFSMSQDYPAEIDNLKAGWIKFNENRQRHYNGYVAKKKASMTQQKGKIGIEYQQLLYLPSNHSLAKRQYQHYDKLYKIKKYQNEQLPMCITVPSLENVKQNRYKKAMLSVLKQEYENYHIVFLDDNSQDGTLEKTKQFLQEQNFPSERVTYVKNLVRNYATYNIIHAAHSFCEDDDIQMMLDGDDRYIGNQVFRFFNAVYQSDSNIWGAYSTYISTYFTYGQSYPINHQLDSKVNGGRKIGHYIGLQRSWYTKLIRQIPLSYHQWNNGTWLNVMADDSIQYSLYQLAGNDRLVYYPQINYYYSMIFNNNKAKKGRKQIRDKAHKEAMKMPRNKLLETLDVDFPPNEEILNVFEADQDKKWTLVY